MARRVAIQEGNRWYPPIRERRLIQWLLLVSSVGTLLTNASFLRFLEPAVSRSYLALMVFAATGCWMLLCRYGLPITLSELITLLRKHAAAIVLVAILVVAFGLRLWGITYGLPQSYISDEYDYVHSYLVMIKRGDLNPRWWFHPSLQPYVNVVTYVVVFWLQVGTGPWNSVHQMQVEDMLYWGRFGAGVLFGTGTVLVTFLLGRRLCGTKVGLVSAALIAVFPGAVEVSQYNKPDSPLTFMIALGVLLTVVYLEKGGNKLALACGIAFGLTVAAKYNGALVALPFVLAVVLRNGRRFLVVPDLYLAALGSVIGFFVGCPYFIADIPRSLDNVADGLYTYGYLGREGAEGVNNWLNHAAYTYKYGAGPFALVFGLASIALMLYRLDAKLAVFLTFPVLYYSYYSSQKMLFPGNLIPVYPFLAVMVAYVGYEMAQRLARFLRARFSIFTPRSLESLVLSGVVIILLWFPTRMSILRNRLVTLPDTGNIAREWVETHFAPGTSFGVERNTPVLDPNRYKVMLEARVINRSLGDYRARAVEYLITTEIIYNRYNPNHPQSKSYQHLFQVCPLVKEFEPVEGKIVGPTVRILRVPAE